MFPRFCLAISIGLAMCSGGTSAWATAPTWTTDEVEASGQAFEFRDLKTQLEKGLRARRPEEFQFVAVVVRMVGEGSLPLPLVQSTFLWARKKGLTTRYPFPYFERALRERAAKQGILIP